ncbi:MAG: P-loop containing nucleoside triphosphate hydrolase protein [Benniella sp.]|nr:MAG: P-loop containing nucleoside triphosphate hydrolase protein [Benniella sp.]
MTSIDQLDLPISIKDTLTKASLDTVEDLLLYVSPIVDDVPVSRHKRHQLSKGSSGSSDRLGNLTPQEYALACEQAAAHIFESRIAYGTAMDLLQEEHWLSLGDPVLDTALGGNGFMTRGITEIAGESAVGKTQLCLQLCLTVQLPLHMGGLDGSAVWLSTEGKFPYGRLESMIDHFIAKHSEALPEMDADEIRDNIYFESMADQETQLHIFNYQLPVLIHDSHVLQDYDEVDLIQDREPGESESEGSEANNGEQKKTQQRRRRKRKPVKLIIVDSITNNFRSEMNVPLNSEDQKNKQGFKSSILQRSADICEIGLRLRYLADQFGLTVVCANQVTDVFLSPGTATSLDSLEGPSMFRALDNPTQFKKPALGLVWENTINVRVVLQRTRSPEHRNLHPHSEAVASSEPLRTLTVIFSPWGANKRGGNPTESGHCRYRIDETGVVGVQ